MNDICPGYCPDDAQHYPAGLACGVLDALPEGIVLLDAKAHVVYCNHTTEHLFGQTLGEIKDQPLCALLHGGSCEGPRCDGGDCQVMACLQALEHGASQLLWQGKVRHHEQGEFSAEIELLRLKAQPPVSYLAVIRRIDEQLLLEERLQQLLQEKTRIENRHRNKNQFFASLSHDLRTPLNAILGFCELLLDDLQRSGMPHLAKDLTQIQQASQHMLGLVNQLLDLAKIEAGHMKLHLDWVDLDELLAQTAATVTPLAGSHGNRLQCENSAGAMRLYTDQTKLRQILFNLLGNACKFTQDGTIRLSARPADIDGVPGVAFEVSDTGIGLSPEHIHQLFTPYVQPDPAVAQQYGGTGLGLCISKLFTEMMGGQIAVHSVLREGTCFTVRLPAVVRDTQLPVALEQEIANVTIQVRQLEGQPGLERRRQVSTVLVIEDDPLISDQVSRILVRDDFRAVTALKPHEGLQLARELQPSLILLDVMMADMDGWAVLKALKAEPDLAAIPVIMLTMLDDKGIAFSLGASDYVHKPIDRGQLLASIKRWIRRARADRILLCHSDPAQRLDLTLRLRAAGYAVDQAGQPEQARRCLQRREPALIVLDADANVPRNREWLEVFQMNETLARVPLLALTQGHGDDACLAGLETRAWRCLDRQGLNADALWHGLNQLIDALVSHPGERLQPNAPI